MRQATGGAVFQAGTSGNYFDISSLAGPRTTIPQKTHDVRNASGGYFRSVERTLLFWKPATFRVLLCLCLYIPYLLILP